MNIKSCYTCIQRLDNPHSLRENNFFIKFLKLSDLSMVSEAAACCVVFRLQSNEQSTQSFIFLVQKTWDTWSQPLLQSTQVCSRLTWMQHMLQIADFNLFWVIWSLTVYTFLVEYLYNFAKLNFNISPLINHRYVLVLNVLYFYQTVRCYVLFCIFQMFV